MSDHFLALPDARTLETLSYRLTQRAIFDLARVEGMGIIHGQAGNGKTFAVRKAVARLKGVEVAWFDFPGRTTPKAIVQALLKEITGIDHEGARSKLEILLLDLLAEHRRVIVIDESQRLHDETIEYLRHLYDRPATHFALALVGGNNCWRRVSRYPMVLSRVYRAIEFTPLSDSEVIAHIPQFHPVYANVDPELLLEIDDRFAHGNLRNWTKFTLDAADLLMRQGLPKLTADLAEVIMGVQATPLGEDEP